VSGVRIALLGGSLRDGSVSLQVLRVCAGLAERFGAEPTLLSAPQLVLPPYLPDAVPEPDARTPANRLLSVLRAADGVIIATPTYHGGMSGLLKNALDHAENLARDTPAYLDGRAVGAVAVGWSEYGAATAVADLRTNIMSLRGWVTPMAVTVNALRPSVVDKGVRADGQVMRRLEIMVGQVVDFARQSTPRRLPASA
jgi:FMN reductase